MTAPAAPNILATLTIVGAGITALEAVGTAAEKALGSDPTIDEAISVLTGIAGIVKSVLGALSAPTPPQDVDATIQSFKDAIAGNNAAIDAMVAAKFPPTSPTA